jgi:hypothetical protein
MALQTAGGFATFNLTDGAQVRDISPVLEDALYYDLHLLGNLNVDFGSAATDIQHWWNEDALNADTVTGASIYNSATTTVNVTAGQGLRVHVGDLLVARNAADTTGTVGLVLQVTAISTDALTTAWIASGATSTSASFSPSFALIPGEQEGSDIGSDKSLTPVVRSNYTHIFAGRYDLKITGSELARQKATTALQDEVAHQLANRAIELKIAMSRAVLYSERVGPGSGTQYRYMGGIRYWNGAGSGIRDTASGSFSYSYLNTQNKSIVDLGVFPDTLIVGTDLVGSITGYDSTNRRLSESDKVAGYTVQQVVLNQGNMVNVVVDPRVNTGDAFLVERDKIKLVPLQGRGMFVIAAVDFADARKRRCLGEWTVELRNPEATGYFSSKL